MNTYLYAAGAIIIGAAIWQLGVWLGETRDKRQKYKDAATYARNTGKMILVAGGPWGVVPVRYWLKIPAHGGGDVCLDIEKRALRNHTSAVVSDVKYIPFRSKSFGSVFASHLLEHLDTIDDAIKALDEMRRVSDCVFIVSPSRRSFAGWIRSGHHLWVWQKGRTIYIKQRGRTAEKRPVTEYVLP